MKLPRFSPHLGKNVVIAVSLVAAGFFIAWLRFRPHLGTQGDYTDGFKHYEGLASEPIRYAVWDRPEELPGEVNTDEAEHRPTTSPDGRWLVFSTGERGLNADLWIAELEDGKATAPRPLYELNTISDELAPAFGDGGLYFATNRPGGRGGFDLWRAAFAGGEFGVAEPLAGGVNGARDETDPAPLPGGEALAFASNRNTKGRTGHDLYLARPGLEGEWTVEPFRELNSPTDDREPAFTRDGRRVVFASDRDGESGSFDLFGSLYDRGEWLPPMALSGLNSDASERGPAPAGDGFSMIFEVEREGRAADLYRARSLELFQHPGPTVGWLDLLILITLLVLALLAWLAKRWESIEVLYKCFLVSAIAHAALLWWFSGIHPEGRLEELVPGSPTFQVRLAAAESGRPAGALERGGALEVEAELAREADGEPEKREEALPEQAAAEAAPALTLLRERAPGAPLPARPIEDAAEPVRLAAAPAASLEDAPRLERRLAGSAPELVVEASSTAAIASPAEESLGDLKRSAELAATVPLRAPRRPRAAKSERLEPEVLPEPSSREPIDRPAALRETARSARLAGPSEAFTRRAEAARELELFAREANQEPAARPGLGPRRVESTAAESPALEALPEPAPTAAMAMVGRSPTAEPPRRERKQSAPRKFQAHAASAVRVPRDFDVERSSVELGPEPERLASLPLAAPAAVPAERCASPPPRPSRYSAERAPLAVAPTRRAFRPETRIAEQLESSAPANRFEHTPYRARFGPAKARALEEYGGSVETEAAVAAGLAYLADRQRKEGFWGDPSLKDDKYGYVLIGKSGLALLAFLGAGHTQASGTEYSNEVERAIQFLLAVQGDRSGHFGNTSAYSHGIATYALAEDYALTRDERLREPLERAVAQILRHQHQRRRDARRFGGWSYYYSGDRTYDSWPRVSITSWQVMALESARLGGLEIPTSALRDAKTFLSAALDQRRGCFLYSHDPSRLRSAYAILPGSTPAALFALSLLGEDLGTDRYADPVSFVLERTPGRYRYSGDDDFVSRARGNLYFWYYGSLAMMRRGGGAWKKWNERLKGTLLDAQRTDGSWKPISIYSNYAGDTDGDAIYSTAMCVLSLEVYYRYFTPLLRNRGGAVQATPLKAR